MPIYQKFDSLEITGDDRENDPAYPSKRLERTDVKHLDPEIRSDLASAGGRLYEQEGQLQLQTPGIYLPFTFLFHVAQTQSTQTTDEQISV